MFRYSVTIFLSAFLLFQVQPIAARMLLPPLGGTANVWTTCISFFQVALLLGYIYAHLIRNFASPFVSGLIHVAVIGIGFLLLDFQTLHSHVESSNIATAIFGKLLFAIGVSFVVLSATSPLVQAWCNATNQKLEAYRLYAWSNLGSLLALITYPVFVEQFGLQIQRNFWMGGYALYFFAILVCVYQCRLVNQWDQSICLDDKNGPDSPNNQLEIRCEFIWWVILSAIASVVLIAATNFLCQEIASHPFLWVLPLIMYLLSLIICFDKPQWYRRRIFQPLLVASIFFAIFLIHVGTNAGLVLQAIGFSFVTLTATTVCHGELYRFRPPPRKLTTFYLAIALGGALGGLFTIFAAPKLFSFYFEFHLALVSCLLASIIIVIMEYVATERVRQRQFYGHVLVSMLAAAPVLCSLIFYTNRKFQPDLIFRGRNDYGIVSVMENDQYRRMVNGQTNHGGQFVAEDMQDQPSAYYSSGSGVDIAFQVARKWNTVTQTGKSQGIDVGIIGLGTGAMLAYADSEDQFRFYEINPMAAVVAREYFDYLQNSSAEVVIGDGRIQLQHETDSLGPHQFDLFFVDAFASDSIPTHLLTQECVELYLKNLAPNGILIFHITNQFVDLRPVIYSIATNNELAAAIVEHENKSFDMETRWVLLSRQKSFLKEPIVEQHKQPWPNDLTPVSWTDNKSALFPVVIWSNRIRLAPKK